MTLLVVTSCLTLELTGDRWHHLLDAGNVVALAVAGLATSLVLLGSIMFIMDIMYVISDCHIVDFAR